MNGIALIATSICLAQASPESLKQSLIENAAAWRASLSGVEADVTTNNTKDRGEAKLLIRRDGERIFCQSSVSAGAFVVARKERYLLRIVKAVGEPWKIMHEIEGHAASPLKDSGSWASSIDAGFSLISRSFDELCRHGEVRILRIENIGDGRLKAAFSYRSATVVANGHFVVDPSRKYAIESGESAGAWRVAYDGEYNGFPRVASAEYGGSVRYTVNEIRPRNFSSRDFRLTQFGLPETKAPFPPSWEDRFHSPNFWAFAIAAALAVLALGWILVRKAMWK